LRDGGSVGGGEEVDFVVAEVEGGFGGFEEAGARF
jgi:hypothetical protein